MIKLENIHVQFGNRILLENESLELNEGDVHVITGESGCGKTTLLYEISLLSNISGCSYEWNEYDIKALTKKQSAEFRKNHIAYVLQNLELMSENMSMAENMRCMFSLSGKEYNETLVKEYLKKMNLECDLDRDIEELSLGQRQRFALVLSLIKDAQMLVLDEPTSALDKDNIIKLMHYLRTIAREYHKIIVIASHDGYVIDNSDVVYNIHNKKIIKRGESIDTLTKNISIQKHSIHKDFYRRYNKSLQTLPYNMIKIIYVAVIVLLCLMPIALEKMIHQCDENYQLYARNEILVVNTLERLPYSRYNTASQLFDSQKKNLLAHIEHVSSVEDYWELEGMLIGDGQNEEVCILPKKGIEQIILPASKKDKTYQLSMNLTLENKTYEFFLKVDNYEKKDYPHEKSINKTVIYMPYTMMKDILKEKGISESSTMSVECDNINNIKDVILEIERWLPQSTVSSSGLEYLSQLNELKKMREFFVLLRYAAIAGIVVIYMIVQSMLIKSRKREINTLRINGIIERDFYILDYFDHRYVYAGVFILSVAGMIVLSNMYNQKIELIDIVSVIKTCMIYIIITRVIPMILIGKSIFNKDISAILREDI